MIPILFLHYVGKVYKNVQCIKAVILIS